jgi:hypothetical protein
LEFPLTIRKDPELKVSLDTPDWNTTVDGAPSDVEDCNEIDETPMFKEELEYSVDSPLLISTKPIFPLGLRPARKKISPPRLVPSPADTSNEPPSYPSPVYRLSEPPRAALEEPEDNVRIPPIPATLDPPIIETPPEESRALPEIRAISPDDPYWEDEVLILMILSGIVLAKETILCPERTIEPPLSTLAPEANKMSPP